MNFMDENRLVVELFFEKPSFVEVSKVAKVFEEAGIKNILMPPEDRGINTHLVIEAADLERAKGKLADIGVEAHGKEVIIIKLENTPGTMADAAQKISEKGINLTYAFSVSMTPTLSYVLLGSGDNKAALEALKE